MVDDKLACYGIFASNQNDSIPRTTTLVNRYKNSSWIKCKWWAIMNALQLWFHLGQKKKEFFLYISWRGEHRHPITILLKFRHSNRQNVFLRQLFPRLYSSSQKKREIFTQSSDAKNPNPPTSLVAY